MCRYFVCNVAVVILFRVAIEQNNDMVSVENFPDIIPLLVQKMVVDFYESILFQRQQSDMEDYTFVNCDRVQCLVIESQVCQPLEMKVLKLNSVDFTNFSHPP